MARESSSLAALNREVWSRRLEYVSSKTIRIKIGTWNVAAIQGTEKDVAGWFVGGKGVMRAFSGFDLPDELPDAKKVKEPVESIEEQESRRTPTRSTLPLNDLAMIPGDSEIDLYVLGLQEIVDVSSPTEALRPYHDKSPSERWKSAVLSALPKGYSLVAEQQLVGMYLVIYASSDVASDISNVSCKFVGTGLMGYMGNKGAVSIRIVLGEATKMVFINSHMAAGASPQSLERRNWDADQIAARIRFAPIDHGHGVLDEVGDGIGDEDFAFWFGDLNYRLADLPGSDIRRLLTIHTNKQYALDRTNCDESAESGHSHDEAIGDVGTDEVAASPTSETRAGISPEQDPTSLETTITSLLPHDELRDQIQRQKAFHQGWQEGKIRFMPTYKYDIGSVGSFDTSEKRRAPSWCDRILFRSKKHYLAFLQDEVAKSTTTSPSPSFSESKLSHDRRGSSFDYDPDEDGHVSDDSKSGSGKSDDSGTSSANQGSQLHENDIKLEYYTSHQRVLSSDHKPLDAVFKLTYTVVDHSLRSLIYQDVARNFDRRENESQPNLSVVVDKSEDKSPSELIDFGDVSFGERTSRTLTVANTGQVDTSFGFVMLDHKKCGRPWLQILCDHPCSSESGIPGVDESYSISPGDAWSVIVAFEVKDPKVAQELESLLDDVLILRVLDGKDHFLSLHARWSKTTLGLSVDQLIRLPESGVRGNVIDNEIKCSAPRELFRLIEGVESSLERCVAEWGMKGTEDVPSNLVASIWPFGNDTMLDRLQNSEVLVDHVQSCLDTGETFDLIKLDVVQRTELFAKVLVRFLEFLQDGIIGAAMWTELRAEMVEFERIKKPSPEDRKALRIRLSEIMSTSAAQNVSFQLLVDMIRRIAGELAGASSSASFDTTEDQSEGKELLKEKYIHFFKDVIFRPRPGADGNVGKESTKNSSRRAVIIRLFTEENK